MALALKQSGDIDGAIAILRKAVELLPDEVTLFTSLASYLFMEKKPVEAIEYLKVALKIDPHSAEIYFNLGFAYGMRGDSEKAIEFYRKGLSADAHHFSCHYNLGVELYKAGKYNEAASHFQEVIRLAPDEETVTMSLKFMGWISEAANISR